MEEIMGARVRKYQLQKNSRSATLTDRFNLTTNKLRGGMFGCNNCQGLTEKYN